MWCGSFLGCVIIVFLLMMSMPRLFVSKAYNPLGLMFKILKNQGLVFCFDGGFKSLLSLFGLLLRETLQKICKYKGMI
ncbi:hypothetical protein D104_09430 [Marinomonas profundimaris]|uniref:Uncharacterized protein n=1 Tax=Marinomonas profundimaris TaxID=1208321 RepID=W1RXK7_9GAMM|nr:hypothetical protein D104_09430 [Marinomonas profundimaris]